MKAFEFSAEAHAPVSREELAGRSADVVDETIPNSSQLGESELVSKFMGRTRVDDQQLEASTPNGFSDCLVHVSVVKAVASDEQPDVSGHQHLSKEIKVCS